MVWTQVVDCGIPKVLSFPGLRLGNTNKQTNKIPTYFPAVFIQEKSQRPREIVVDCLLGRHPKPPCGLGWPPGPGPPSPSPSLFTALLGGDLIPCQSGQGCSGSQACIASTSQDPFDIFYLLLSLQTHRDPLPVTAIQGLTPLVWMGNGEFSFLGQKSLLIP